MKVEYGFKPGQKIVQVDPSEVIKIAPDVGEGTKSTISACKASFQHAFVKMFLFVTQLMRKTNVFIDVM